MALPILIERLSSLAAFTRLGSTLPRERGRQTVTGLAGSADAVLLAALAMREPNRLFVVVADQLPEAERWLADLQSVLGDDGVALYPPREGFGEVEPHAEVAGERVETLEKLARGAVRVLLTTARAVQERTRMPRALADARLELRAGEAHRLEDLVAHLERVGFEKVTLVEDVAQFSVRGGILDVYGFGMNEPVRLEFWGDELNELRHFDVSSQRTTGPAAVAVILPVEVQGEEAELRYERASLPDLWPPGTLVLMPYGVALKPEMERTWQEAEHHLDLARRRGEAVAPRHELLQPPEATLRALAAFPTLVVISESEADADTTVFPLRAPEPIERDMARLAALVRDGTPTVILCDNAGQAERLEELLDAGAAGRSPAALVIGVLGGGFLLPPRGTPDGLRVLTDHEIFRRERRIRRSRRYATGTALEHVTALKPGDYVVHLEHGVGIYRGMTTIFHGEATIEVAVIEYEGGDRLNVPLYRLDQIEKYRAAGDVNDDAPAPRLHKLGGKKWGQQKERTRSALREMTAELLDLYARRKVASRAPHHPDGPWQKQLESSFLFEDTPDQRKATEDVKRDMEGARPMDRLLVGDVGYGKTEIAVRAAFKAIQSGRQVAVLVPTTVLAEQHARTFGDRFADFPVKIAVMSRFQTQKEQAASMVDLAAGTVDVVIGTHRLLSPDITFKQLGLIIVDEEHRFGVKHKERLKQLKLETDVLTLTATPIPRTLHQSLAGLRDMTLMQTPPRDRSPVLTFLEPWDDGLIDEGIARELDRGGQVFFVHNRIETIEAISDHVRRVIPRARARRRRPRTDEGARARADHAAVRRGRDRRARLDADRRERHRRAECEHDVREPRRPARPRAALPAARARRAVAPSRLLLSHRPRVHRRGRGAPAPRPRAPHRAGRGVPDRAQGPRAARGGEPPRSRAVGIRARRRLRPLPAAARRDGHADDARRLGPAAAPDRRHAGPAQLPAGRVHRVAGGEARPVPASRRCARRGGGGRAPDRGPRPIRAAAAPRRGLLRGRPDAAPGRPAWRRGDPGAW